MILLLYFNPEVTIPCTKYFWAHRKMITIGITTITDAAINWFQSMYPSLLNIVSASCTVFIPSEFVMISGHI